MVTGRRACPLIFLVLVVPLAACQPEDRTPGLWLRGEVVEAFPSDWSFSNAHGEIAIEVATPYLVPHSVTIWCAEVDGTLYVAAARAAEKNWPGWVDDDPDVVLKIGEQVYRVRLEGVANEQALVGVSRAYAVKYKLGDDSPLQPGTRYWRVAPRTG